MGGFLALAPAVALALALAPGWALAQVMECNHIQLGIGGASHRIGQRQQCMCEGVSVATGYDAKCL